MLVVRGEATQRKLCTLCGHSEKTTAAALELLAALGYVTRDNYRKWALTASAEQVISGLSEVGEIPTSDPTTTTTSTQPQEEQESKEESSESVDVVVVARRNRKISQVVSILRGAGIGEPKRSRLARMDHVTPEYARILVEKAKRDKTDTALLIHQIANADPMPDTSDWLNVCSGCYDIVHFDAACRTCRRCPRCCECEPYEDAAEVDEGGAGGDLDGCDGLAGADPSQAFPPLRAAAPKAHSGDPSRSPEPAAVQRLQWSGGRSGVVKIGDIIPTPVHDPPGRAPGATPVALTHSTPFGRVVGGGRSRSPREQWPITDLSLPPAARETAERERLT